MAALPRIALVGLHLESNSFAPPTTGADFHRLCYLEGPAIVAEAAKPAPAMPLEVPGFVDELSRLAFAWEPVPILVTGAEPGGPVEQEFFDDCVRRIVAGLKAAGRVDAVYLTNHGAMTATAEFDPDGVLYAAIRATVGPVPFVASVDLHANISDRMIDSVDAFVSYRTNPHVDQRERGAECARHVVELLRGTRASTALVRLPLTPASVTLLTASGPYADLMNAAEARMEADPRLMNLSVVGGFVFGDTPKNGVAIVATSREGAAHARAAALDLARQAWADRKRFVRTLTSVAAAIELVLAAARKERPPVIFADSGDNPGGGGRGNTTELLRALIAARPAGVYFGNFVDPALARAAHAHGLGDGFVAEFNRTNADIFGERFGAPARVVALTDGRVVGRRGIYKGRSVELGPTAVLDLGGISVVVASARKQCADPVFFEMHGLDLTRATAVAVKSRGHFRAGFDEFFAPENVFEIDTGGLTAPVLERISFKHLPRPVFPLDPAASWEFA
ncbi:MAG: M81 family metallopeptidase [Proteobacteria bacterium]|nr:M81 family metallopeptidase [Pseudomonadota bacterium]